MDRSWGRSSAGAVKVDSVCKKWNLTSNLANVQADHTNGTAKRGIVIGLPVRTMTRRNAKKIIQTNLAVELVYVLLAARTVSFGFRSFLLFWDDFLLEARNVIGDRL